MKDNMKNPLSRENIEWEKESGEHRWMKQREAEWWEWSMSINHSLQNVFLGHCLFQWKLNVQRLRFSPI